MPAAALMIGTILITIMPKNGRLKKITMIRVIIDTSDPKDEFMATYRLLYGNSIKRAKREPEGGPKVWLIAQSGVIRCQ